MKLNRILTLVLLILGVQSINAQMETQPQSDLEMITHTLMDYIEGTANGEPERIKRAFHADLNLYSVANNDSLKVWAGRDYIGVFKEGVKNNRVGKIVSIDYVNNAASAKIEILMPGTTKVFTDYLLLLKLNGNWKIIHKSYTLVNY